MKFKRKSRKIMKRHDGELYIFKNGVAKVPGCTFMGKPVTITLKEFKELAS